ncbi:hypothetical protein SAMN05216330_111107 [Bradyrhizobium sp. Ghvi]|uniref:hypothetical protein n=1 Tax=Bradyrhizobium sp. Ghvi TaxID=1855319 RepID=UPI0008F325A5|nr:hypothetical protein [Bradyrhizobium sp. Ghvi]SFP87534.1 hypothetical protein SAMN05216330_111107 [Bradyrhizobium sp. Ghvi]
MTWVPIFLMPNLRVGHELIANEMAIVPVDDERITEYAKQFPDFRRFVRKFTDPFGRRIAPGILLLNTNAPPTFRTIEAVSSFRDLLTLSVVPLQRARGIIHGHSHHIQYSDYFDFYPWTFNDQNGHLVCNTPGLVGLHEVSAFKGQSSPILSALDFNRIDVDAPLLKALMARWCIRYSTLKPEWADRALFRSLNMAMAASKMPAGADVTNFDLGRNLGLWVSAFEILTHTGQEKLRLAHVYDKVGGAPWRSKKTKRKVFSPHHSQVKRNLGCWIYGEIYRVRNHFIHGEPVAANSLIVKRSRRNLFSYAPMLYRMLLTGFLNLPEPSSIQGTEWSRERFDLTANQGDIEDALLTVLVTEAEYRAHREAKMARVRMRSRQATPPQTQPS